MVNTRNNTGKTNTYCSEGYVEPRSRQRGRSGT